MSPPSADRASEGRAGENDELNRPQARYRSGSSLSPLSFQPQAQQHAQQPHRAMDFTTAAEVARAAGDRLEEASAPGAKHLAAVPAAAAEDRGMASGSASVAATEAAAAVPGAVDGGSVAAAARVVPGSPSAQRRPRRSDNGGGGEAAAADVGARGITDPGKRRALLLSTSLSPSEQHDSSSSPGAASAPPGSSCGGSSSSSPAAPGALLPPPPPPLSYSSAEPQPLSPLTSHGALPFAGTTAAVRDGGGSEAAAAAATAAVPSPTAVAAAAAAHHDAAMTSPRNQHAASPTLRHHQHSPPQTPDGPPAQRRCSGSGDGGSGGGNSAREGRVVPSAAAAAAAVGLSSTPSRRTSLASGGPATSPMAVTTPAKRRSGDGGMSSAGGNIGWALLQQQQQQQQQQAAAAAAAAAAVAAAGLPLLSIPTATVSYTPWGPVLPVVQVPAAAALAAASGGGAANAAGGGGAAVVAAALQAAAAAGGPAALALAGGLPSAVAAATPADVTAHAAAALQLVAAAAAAAASPPTLTTTTAAATPAVPAAPASAAIATASSGGDPATASQLRLAVVLREGGKMSEALMLVESLLLRQPSCLEAMHMRAQCQQALGQVQEAIASYHRCLALASDHVASLVALGALYQSQGLLGEAVAAYQRAYELRPEDAGVREGLAVVLTDQGTKLKNAGASLSDVVSRYQAAAALFPRCAPALYNLGVVAGELRQGAAAAEYYRAAIAAEPRYAQAHCNLGVLLREQGRLAEAVAAYEAALAAAPNFAIVRNNMAIALTDLGTHVKNEGRLDEGIALYERALSYSPRHGDALYNLGVAYGEKGDLQRAAFMYEMALAFNPGCAEAHNNLGVIWKEQDNIERAVESYTAALSLRPNFPQSLNNLGVVMTAQGRAAEALTLLSAAVTALPSYTEAHNNLGVLQRDVGCIPDALASYSRCLELDPNCRNAGQNRLLALNYIYQGEDELVCAAHREWGQRFQAAISPLPPLGPGDRSWDPDRPLRIGYISPDLFTHSVSYFAEAPLTHHSPARGLKHIVYSCVPKPDSKTTRLRAATLAAGGEWREAAGLSEEALAGLVRADEVDLLVELTGHTANNRLGCMARRPAPVQVTWIGYPNSTGLAAVDYRITDEICDPWDTRQAFVEQLVRLPRGCFLCYTPAVDAPPVSPLPALTNGFITFGSFNNLAKITPQVLRVWGAILTAVPRSRLVLKNKPFACEAARAHVMRQLQEVGIEPWRVDLLPLAPGNAQHLATYALMDISLDPFPYAGTTTTTESLFMGVPCLTLAGRCHAHNVGVSLLTAVGLHPPPPPSATTTASSAAAVAAAAASAPVPPAFCSGQNLACSNRDTNGYCSNMCCEEDTCGGNMGSINSGNNSCQELQHSGVCHSPRCNGSNCNASCNGSGGYSSSSGSAAATAAGVGGNGAAATTLAGSHTAHANSTKQFGCNRPTGHQRSWVAFSEEEYVALAVAHASDVQALAELRSTLRERMLHSPMCDGPAFVAGLEGVYRGLWRRHCAQRAGDAAAAEAVEVAAGLRPATR